jgi:hypothetical protein
MDGRAMTPRPLDWLDVEHAALLALSAETACKVGHLYAIADGFAIELAANNRDAGMHLATLTRVGTGEVVHLYLYSDDSLATTTVPVS